MPSPSFRESWLGFVAVLVRLRLLQNILRGQVLQQVCPKFHHPWVTSLSDDFDGFSLTRQPCATVWSYARSPSTKWKTDHAKRRTIERTARSAGATDVD